MECEDRQCDDAEYQQASTENEHDSLQRSRGPCDGERCESSRERANRINREGRLARCDGDAQIGRNYSNITASGP